MLAFSSARVQSKLGLLPVRIPVRQLVRPLMQRGALCHVHGIDQVQSTEDLYSMRSLEAAASDSEPSSSGSLEDGKKYCIVNFYHLTSLPDPDKVVEQHRRYLEDKDVRGRIWVSSQGINAQLGGEEGDAVEYADWVSRQKHFEGFRYSVWPASGHMFPKLRLKHKPNLISLGGGMTTLPVTDPSWRATPVEPAEWRKMLTEAKSVRTAIQEGKDDVTKEVVILDLRNDYEWDAGHFEGANRPSEEEFNNTPIGDSTDDVPDPLKGRDKNTPVMMYCTGGIRCDVYSAHLRQKGYRNLYTLEGGIQRYLREEGGEGWNGSLFVFDGRMAIAPGNYDGTSGPLPAAVPCQVCGSRDAQLPHVNCANIDCNELFIACEACKINNKGCCCEECMTAPRLLRPINLDGGHYGNWGNYVDPSIYGPVMAVGRSREGRVARRRRRREMMQAKRSAALEEKLARKKMVKEAMKKLEALSTQEEGSKVPA